MNLVSADKSGVMPVDKPVVVSALSTSKEIALRLRGSMNETTNVEVKKTANKEKKITNDFSTVLDGMDFLNRVASSLPVQIAKSLANITAKVLVRMPPPTLPEEPPMNISRASKRNVVLLNVPISTVVKPPFLAVADKKKALLNLSKKSRWSKVFCHSATENTTKPINNRME